MFCFKLKSRSRQFCFGGKMLSFNFLSVIKTNDVWPCQCRWEMFRAYGLASVLSRLFLTCAATQLSWGDKIETRSRCYVFRKPALAACEPKTYEILLPREQLNKSIFLRALRIREIIYLLHYPHGLGAFGHPPSPISRNFQVLTETFHFLPSL